jgi:hypothetical protein
MSPNNISPLQASTNKKLTNMTIRSKSLPFTASPLRQPHQFFEFQNFQKPRGGCYKNIKEPRRLD